MTTNRDFLAPFTPKPSDDFFESSYWQTQIEKSLDEFHHMTAIRFVLFLKEHPNTAIGTANITQIFRGAFQAAFLGFGLSFDNQGSGLMFEALTAIIDYVFKVQNLHRIMATLLPDNNRSASLLKRLGFEVEGLAKDYLYINGRWQDHVLTSLKNDLWTIPRF